ncbi:MAG: Pyrophosphate--fructose 6-phosphate 1-phosphotransferase [Planctomycetota bacterium]|jgi:6-phosphofructokinase 1
MTAANTSGIKRVAMLFAGGPAPAANAVISTAAFSFLNAGIEVVGIKHGYSKLIDYTPAKPLVEGEDYFKFQHSMLHHSRTSQGIVIGTARTNPGKSVSAPEHLTDPEKSAPIRRVYEGLCSIGADALISIGGDDTLKTANKIKMYQDTLPAGSKKLPVVHLPKTIDNDYMGIDFTFGYFTAAETLASEIRNLNYDAEAGRAYYIAETMGRSAGWLSYGAAIAGEACMVLSVEDINGALRSEEVVTDPATGKTVSRPIMNLEKVLERIVKVMQKRDSEGRHYGVIVLAEGLAEYLPVKYLQEVSRDDHGHISIANVNLGRMVSKLLAEAYKAKTGNTRKVTGLQLGYESRCAKPQAFDVMLGSQIGVGAYLALVEKKLNGVMVSVGGQLNLHYVPFETLVDPKTLVTKVRYIETDSDFYRLARFLETYVDD